jgi:hypothetical protein
MSIFAIVASKLCDLFTFSVRQQRITICTGSELTSCMICPMSSSSSLSQTYLKFVNLVKAVRQKDDLFALDPVDERLLNSFATVWGAGRRLTASDAALIVPDVAPRTVQRRVAALIDKGMLRVESDVKDSRIKYFLATGKTNTYFIELGKCLEQAKRK